MLSSELENVFASKVILSLSIVLAYVRHAHDSLGEAKVLAAVIYSKPTSNGVFRTSILFFALDADVTKIGPRVTFPMHQIDGGHLDENLYPIPAQSERSRCAIPGSVRRLPGLL